MRSAGSGCISPCPSCMASSILRVSREALNPITEVSGEADRRIPRRVVGAVAGGEARDDALGMDREPVDDRPALAARIVVYHAMSIGHVPIVRPARKQTAE